MPITSLKPLPSRVNRPDTLDDDTELFFAKLDQYGEDIESAKSQAVAASEAGAGGYSFVFDFGTSSTDMPLGGLRFDNVNLGIASMVYLSSTTSTGSPIGALIDTFDDSDSITKGTLRVLVARDPSRWAVFKLMGVATPNVATRAINIIPVSSSDASPFQPGVTLAVQYAQNGDRGAQGIPGSTLAEDVLDDMYALTLSF